MEIENRDELDSLKELEAPNGLESGQERTGGGVRQKPGHAGPYRPRVGLGHYPEHTGTPGNASST